MLEKPDLHDAKIVACLRNDYGIRAAQIAFLPLGVDRNTAVYRVVADDAAPYFLKLRAGVFDQISVTFPKFLSDQGVEHIIAPLTTKTGQLWTSLDAFTAILYPFVEGRDGYEVNLSDRHWREFGTALKRIHTAVVPPSLTRHLRQETYAPQWREIVKTFLGRLGDDKLDDPVAVKLTAFLNAKRDEILDLVTRAECLAEILQARLPEFVVCHSDLHAGNILIGDSTDALYIVDWDDPILACKERDLMYAGGGQFANRRAPQEEEALFYQGYGETQVDPVALAYYRYERIVTDIAVYCEQLFLTAEGGQDREQSLRYLISNFLPNNTIEIAYRADQTLRASR